MSSAATSISICPTLAIRQSFKDSKKLKSETPKKQRHLSNNRSLSDLYSRSRFGCELCELNLHIYFLINYQTICLICCPFGLLLLLHAVHFAQIRLAAAAAFVG